MNATKMIKLTVTRIGFCLFISKLVLSLGCIGYSQQSVEGPLVKTNGDFALKLSYDPFVGDGLFAGYGYVVESKWKNEAWRFVFGWRQDEPLSLDEIQLEVLEGGCAYFFNSRKFGITRDNGASWNIKNISQLLKDEGLEAKPGDGPIRLEIDVKGFGRILVLDPELREKRTSVLMLSRDFGKSWYKL